MSKLDSQFFLGFVIGLFLVSVLLAVLGIGAPMLFYFQGTFAVASLVGYLSLRRWTRTSVR